MTKAATSPYRKFSGVEEADRLFLIYQTAARAIHKKGYDATSLQDIADAVGVTKGGLYHYIDGKKGLLFQIMSYALDLLESEVIRPVSAISGAERQLRAIIQLHTALIIDKAIEMTILLEETAGLTAEHLELITTRRMEYYRFVRAVVQQLKDEGKLRDLDVTIATHNLIGQLQWLARWYNDTGRLTREEVIHEFTKATLLALLRPATRKPSQQTTRKADKQTPRAKQTARK